MHHQVMMLDEEIGSPLTFESLGWLASPGSNSSANYTNFEIYMGLCDAELLTSNFQNNYIPGSRTLVYSNADLTINAAVGEWFSINLDTPYEYNGTDNLLIEIIWESGTNSIYVYKWNTGAVRSLKGASFSAETGVISTDAYMIDLIPSMGFAEESLAWIKANGFNGEQE
jgi:hypothetical protein